MFDHEIPDDSVAAGEQWNAEPKKRNCGRTGPTSPEGRAASSRNAIKHGACCRTLVLPDESEEAWELVLAHFCKTYLPTEDSLEYDFVLKTAQAEWHRIRAQRNYDSFTCHMQGMATFNWTPDEIKKHDLALRYKTAAERAFQREYRLLEQHYKAHGPKPVKEPVAQETAAPQEPAEENEPDLGPAILFVEDDPNSPTGYTVIERCVPERPPATPQSTSTAPPAAPPET